MTWFASVGTPGGARGLRMFLGISALAACAVGVDVAAQSAPGGLHYGAGRDARPRAGIVDSVVNAPVVPDGTTTGRVTDFVINLDSDPNPAVAGRSLPAGRSIRVTLPDGFERDPAVPFRTLFSDPSCVPLNIQCNTAVLLQGWPQHPVGFPPPNMPNLWTVGFEEDTNTVVVTALRDLPANPPGDPGIKQVHLLLAGFTNPSPGLYGVRVAAETGPDEQPEIGWGDLLVGPRPGPTVAVTSAFNPGAPNTIYQATTTGSPTPLPYDLLLWDRHGGPLLDLSLQPIDGSHALLHQEGREIGLVTIAAPRRASGQLVFALTPSFLINSPVVGAPTALLRVFFTAGDVAGEYMIRFHLFEGNSVETFVTVQ